jgi:hypothetical protein
VPDDTLSDEACKGKEFRSLKKEFRSCRSSGVRSGEGRRGNGVGAIELKRGAKMKIAI